MQDLFDNFEKQAVRVETLPSYKVEGGYRHYLDFLEGKPARGDAQWCSDLKKWTGEGKKIKRIRVISGNLTPYEKFEFYCYHENFAAGEEIYVVSREKYDELVAAKTAGDFWLFDNAIVCKMSYSESGEYLGFSTSEDADYVQQHMQLFSELEDNVAFGYRQVVKQINNSETVISFDKGKNEIR